MNYFENIVLPSVKLKKQKEYDLKEAEQILCVSRRSVRRYIQNYKNQTGRVRLKVEENGTISYNTFVEFFKKGRYEK